MDHKRILLGTAYVSLGIWIIFLILGMLFNWFAGMFRIFFAYSLVLLPLWILVVFGFFYFTELFGHVEQ